MRAVGIIFSNIHDDNVPELARIRTLGSIPFGGRYRLIDFPLSNCVNSGIDTVGVLTQYQPLELNDYLGNGEPWDLDRTNGGVHVLSPYQQIEGTSWYKGTANAIYQNINFIDKYDPEYVVILSGDSCRSFYCPIILQQVSNRLPCFLGLRIQKFLSCRHGELMF